jgi:NitT/TauT family transport system substrate-binding protein
MSMAETCKVKNNATQKKDHTTMSITLMENLRAVFYAPFYAAFSLGAYEAEGLEVHLEMSLHPAETVNTLLTGKAQVVWGGPIRVMMANDRNPDCGLVIFCEVVGRDPFFLVGREPRAGFQVDDLMAAKLATVSEVPTPWLCLQHDLRLAGCEPAAVERIADRSMSENVAALRAGEVDVVQLFQPFVEPLLEENAGHIWYAAADRGPTAYTSLYTTQAFLERDPQTLLRMTRAMYRTLTWITTHDPGDLAACVAAYFPDLPKAILTRALGRYKALGLWNHTPILAPEGYAWLQAACRSGGLIETGFPYDHCVDMQFAEQVIGEEPAAL